MILIIVLLIVIILSIRIRGEALMKKLSFFLVMFFLNIVIMNAECTYKEIKEINTMASYITTNYQYNDKTSKFDLRIVNLSNLIAIEYEGKLLFPENGEVVIKDLELGSQIKATATSITQTECYGQILRTITVNLPYLNPFYNDKSCAGHENLNVCNSRFLDYKITRSTFRTLIEKNKENIFKDSEEEPNKVVKPVFWESVWSGVKKYSIPVILVIVSTLISSLIMSVIYRRIKHGF